MIRKSKKAIQTNMNFTTYCKAYMTRFKNFIGMIVNYSCFIYEAVKVSANLQTRQVYLEQASTTLYRMLNK